jgi:hypothetical protein
LTGIPFVGSAIGRAYDYGTGMFGSKSRDMSQFNRLGLFGLPPGTLDEEDKITQPLTEAELNAYSRFGDIGLPNQNTVNNVTDTGYPGENKNFFTTTDDLISTGVQEGPYRGMYDYLEAAPINTGGITQTSQFDLSPYGRIGDYDEIQ